MRVFFIHRKLLAGPVVPKRLTDEQSQITPFDIISEAVRHLQRKVKGVQKGSPVTYLVYRIRNGIQILYNVCAEVSKESILWRKKRELGAIKRKLFEWKKVKIIEA